jgi:hypothetical protein
MEHAEHRGWPRQQSSHGSPEKAEPHVHCRSDRLVVPSSSVPEGECEGPES